MEHMSASRSVELAIGGLSLNAETKASKALVQLPVRLSILVAEDEITRSLVGAVSKDIEQDTTFATNGREVLDLMGQPSGFDLILMDIDMPIMDRFSASMALGNGESVMVSLESGGLGYQLSR
jgi:PleD family two-component response regulator